MKVRQGGYNDLKKSEKIIFIDGIKSGKWTKTGVHLDSNPYKQTRRITE